MYDEPETAAKEEQKNTNDVNENHSQDLADQLFASHKNEQKK